MVKWRFGIFFVMLLVLPLRTETEDAEEEEESENDGDHGYDDEKEKEDDGGEEASERENTPASINRRPVLLSRSHKITSMTLKSTKRSSLECYVCSYKSEMPQRACLDPSKFRVRKLICDNVDDKCFTTGLTNGNTYDAVVRGCRSSCQTTQETECCDSNQCNNRAYAVPVMAQKAVTPSDTADGGSASNNCKIPMPPNVLYFVTILLILETVGRIAFF